tara:strand:+ start:111 stop:290 length:180 start_codon:yes stop_codon:yes gene_type:complete
VKLEAEIMYTVVVVTQMKQCMVIGITIPLEAEEEEEQEELDIGARAEEVMLVLVYNIVT